MPEKNNYLFIILIILALEAILFSVGNDKVNLAFLNNENKLAKIQNILAGIPVQAKAFSIYDETSDIKIYGKNDETEMPIASLAKIMTVVTALNNHKVNDVISISSEALKQEGDYGFFINEKFNIEDLAKFTLVGSANDGAYALTENVDNFLQKMNDKAVKIGMENTLFFNFTGLDIDNGFAGPPRVGEPLRVEAGAYASAQDVNVMALYAFKEYPEIFGASIMPEINIKSESGVNHNIKNTNSILNRIPDILFSKTGLTPLAGGNLTIIYKNKYGHNIAITILGSTSEGRFSDIEKIVNTLNDLNYGS